VHTQLLLLVVPVYPRIPRLIRIHRPKAALLAAIAPARAAVTRALVCAARSPAAAERVPLIADPALDTAWSWGRCAVVGGVPALLCERVEVWWGEA
jgi:hypothetical protein